MAICITFILKLFVQTVKTHYLRDCDIQDGIRLYIVFKHEKREKQLHLYLKSYN